MPTQRKKPAGIICPNCGRAMRGTYRTTQHTGHTDREKYCPGCGQRVDTREQPIDLAHPRGVDRVALAEDLAAFIIRHDLAELVKRHL